jgi:hypothetical protein
MATTITGNNITASDVTVLNTVTTTNLAGHTDIIDLTHNIVLPNNKNVKKNIESWNPLTGTTAGSVTEPQDIVPRTLDAWEIVANIGMSNANPGLRYRHIKLNITSSSAMIYFWLNGYGYNYGNIDTKMGMYMYTGSSILNKYINNHGNQVTFTNSYKAGDGKLVLLVDLGSTSYTSARAQLYVKGHDDQYNSDNIEIESIYSTSTTSAVY